MTTETVDVPEEFRRIGYSGLFHTEATFDGTATEADEWAAKTPCLMRQSGWMALRLNRTPDGPSLTLVRRDANAVVEAFMRPL